VDSLKALDPKRPIREADMPTQGGPVGASWSTEVPGLRFSYTVAQR